MFYEQKRPFLFSDMQMACQIDSNLACLYLLTKSKFLTEFE